MGSAAIAWLAPIADSVMAAAPSHKGKRGLLFMFVFSQVLEFLTALRGIVTGQAGSASETALQIPP
jgi:hypothetical protein